MSKMTTEAAAIMYDDMGTPETDMTLPETSADRLFAALETQEATDAFEEMETERTLYNAPFSMLERIYFERKAPF